MTEQAPNERSIAYIIGWDDRWAGRPYTVDDLLAWLAPHGVRCSLEVYSDPACGPAEAWDVYLNRDDRVYHHCAPTLLAALEAAARAVDAER